MCNVSNAAHVNVILSEDHAVSCVACDDKLDAAFWPTRNSDGGKPHIHVKVGSNDSSIQKPFTEMQDDYIVQFGGREDLVERLFGFVSFCRAATDRIIFGLDAK